MPTIPELTAKRDALEQELQVAATAGDGKKLEQLSREHKRVVEHLGLLGDQQSLQEQLVDTASALEDPDLAALATEDHTRITKELAAVAEKLRVLEQPVDPMDERGALVEIRAGAGGDESGLFAAELCRMYTRFAENHGWHPHLVSTNRTGIGGYKEAIIEIPTPGAFGLLRWESGVHRVQRVPETEKAGRVHTSTATVAVLPIVEEVDVSIKPEDIKMEVTTSSGHGGQSVNTTYSAVRLLHIPTGITVQCQDERSQKQNREKGMNIMRARVFAFEEEKKRKAATEQRKQQIGTGDRSEKIRTYNFPQNRLTDHRIKQNFHNLTGVMEGELDDIIAAVQTAAHQPSAQ